MDDRRPAERPAAVAREPRAPARPLVRWATFALAAAWSTVAIQPTAQADEASRLPTERHWLERMDVQAGRVEADLRMRELSLHDGVQVRLEPYYLRADSLVLSATPWGVDVRGSGIVAFCPCPDPPLSIGFAGGWAAPPHSLIVRHPTLRLFGLPVFWLPYLWLRSPHKIGFGVPELAFRGVDGLFVGESLHVPVASGLDLAGGGYLQGGGMGRVFLRTTSSRSIVALDLRPDSAGHIGAGLQVDARGHSGATGPTAASVAWDVDLARGSRARRTLVELDALARPHDRGDVVVHSGVARAGVTLLDRRAGPVDRVAFIHPFVGFSLSRALDGRVLQGGASLDAAFGPRVRFGRVSDVVFDSSMVLSLARVLGAAQGSLLLRTDVRTGRAVDDAPRPGSWGTSSGGMDTDVRVAAIHELALQLGVPLGRPLGVSPEHTPRAMALLEPLVRTRLVLAHGRDDGWSTAGWLGQGALDPVREVNGAGLVSGGLRFGLRPLVSATSRGNPGRLFAELDAGVLSTPGNAWSMAGLELTYELRAIHDSRFTARVQAAATQPLESGLAWTSSSVGYVTQARVHWEAARRLVGAEVWTGLRGNVPALAGWSILDRALAPGLGVPAAFADGGTNLGGALGVPLGALLRVGGDAEVHFKRTDLDDLRWMAWRARVRYAHPCGCMRLHVRAGRVLGREGWDVLADLELVRSEPEGPLDL